MNKFILGVLLLACSAIFSYAQKEFQGTIRYKISVSGEDKESAEMFALMMPTHLTIAVLKGKILVDFEGGLLASLGYYISEPAKGNSYRIIDSEKIIKVYKDSPKKEDSGSKASNDVAESEILSIAGYKCKKYKSIDEEGSVTELWRSESIILPTGKSSAPLISGAFSSAGNVLGTPLKMRMTTGGFEIIFYASEVSSKAPEKSRFQLPKGYKKEPGEE